MFNQLLKMLKKSLGKAVLVFRSAGSQKYFTAQIKRQATSHCRVKRTIAIIYLALKVGPLGHENN